MDKAFSEFSTGAKLLLSNENKLETYTSSDPLGLYTFIWPTHTESVLKVDGVPVRLKPNQIVALTPVQRIEFISGEQLRVYQFNREFYCIKDHDKEVSCVGLLFFGSDHLPIITLTAEEQKKFELVHQVFLEEIETEDTIQAEMLRMMMTRLIIKITRIFKASQQLDHVTVKKSDLFRAFNLLVEDHFREEHSVAFYADKLFKSAKTLSNSFSNFGKSPLQIIHERITLEAKRLLQYSDKSAKEIAYELGFDDASHLSRLFKKQTGVSPSLFRKGKIDNKKVQVAV